MFPFVISRGTLHQPTREASISKGRNLNEFSQQPVIWPQKLGSFTCPKFGTWGRLFDFPSEGRHAEDFYMRKIQRLRPGLNPRTREPEASMLTTRPPKPSRRGRLLNLIKFITPWDRVSIEGIKVTKSIEKCHAFFKVGFHIHNRRLLVTHSEPASSNPYPYSGKKLSRNATYILFQWHLLRDSHWPIYH
jgi:hypothetical protein